MSHSPTHSLWSRHPARLVMIQQSTAKDTARRTPSKYPWTSSARSHSRPRALSKSPRRSSTRPSHPAPCRRHRARSTGAAQNHPRRSRIMAANKTALPRHRRSCSPWPPFPPRTRNRCHRTTRAAPAAANVSLCDIHRPPPRICSHGRAVRSFIFPSPPPSPGSSSNRSSPWIVDMHCAAYSLTYSLFSFTVNVSRLVHIRIAFPPPTVSHAPRTSHPHLSLLGCLPTHVSPSISPGPRRPSLPPKRGSEPTPARPCAKSGPRGAFSSSLHIAVRLPFPRPRTSHAALRRPCPFPPPAFSSTCTTGPPHRSSHFASLYRLPLPQNTPWTSSSSLSTYGFSFASSLFLLALSSASPTPILHSPAPPSPRPRLCPRAPCRLLAATIVGTYRSLIPQYSKHIPSLLPARAPASPTSFARAHQPDRCPFVRPS